MKKLLLSLGASIFAALLIGALSLPVLSAIAPEPSELQAKSQVLDAIHDIISGMNKADLGVFYNNPTFAKKQVEYTTERAEGMRCYGEGKYDEALLHLDRAYSILRNSSDWTQLE